jgi:hypothetical protein
VTTLTKILVNTQAEVDLINAAAAEKASKAGKAGGSGGAADAAAAEVVNEHGEPTAGGQWTRTVVQTPFNHLSLEVPPCPLFRDSEGGLVIPQVPLFQVLQKFDGATWTDSVTSESHVRRRYRLLRLPRFLVLHLVRFTRNNFYLEKNPTIVTFPVKNLEMKEFLVRLHTDTGSGNSDPSSSSSSSSSMAARSQRAQEQLARTCPRSEQLGIMGRGALLDLVRSHGSELHKMQAQRILNAAAASPTPSTSSKAAGAKEEGEGGNMDSSKKKSEEEVLAELRLVAHAVVERVSLFSSTKYDLLANICNQSNVSSSSTSKGGATGGGGGVTVGDINMFLGGTSGGGKGGASRGGGSGGGTAHVGTGLSSGSDAAASASASAAGTAAATVSSNNKVLNDCSYKVHLQHKATGQWFELHDLRVSEVAPQLIGKTRRGSRFYMR